MTETIKQEIRERISRAIGSDIGEVYPAFYVPAEGSQMIMHRAQSDKPWAFVKIWVLGWKRPIDPTGIVGVGKAMMHTAETLGGVFILN